MDVIVIPDLDAMHKRWEDDLAKLPMEMSFTRESLSRAIADLADERKELEEAA